MHLHEGREVPFAQQRSVERRRVSADLGNALGQRGAGWGFVGQHGRAKVSGERPAADPRQAVVAGLLRQEINDIEIAPEPHPLVLIGVRHFKGGENPGDAVKTAPGGHRIRVRPRPQPGQAAVKSIVLFTHNTYALNDWLNFTAGLRWTKDKKSGYANNVGNPFPSGIFIIENHNVTFSKSWQAWTPKFILDGTFDEVGPFDTLFVYASVARGFKSGGFVSSVTAEASSTPIEPELVWSYEGGVKSVFWQDRAHLNLTYYRADYKDLQTTIIPTGGRSFLTVNAGKAKVEGIELEAMALLTEQLLFNFTYAWTDARFTSFVIPPDRDFTGNRVAQSPKHSWTADLSYTAQMGPGEAQLSLNYVYRGDSYFDADNATLESIIDDTDFGQLNLTASYRWGDWQVSLWGKNLNDDRAVFNGLTVFGQFSQLSPTEVLVGEPFISGVVSPGRSYGLSVRKIWGDY